MFVSAPFDIIIIFTKGSVRDHLWSVSPLISTFLCRRLVTCSSTYGADYLTTGQKSALPHIGSCSGSCSPVYVGLFIQAITRSPDPHQLSSRVYGITKVITRASDFEIWAGVHVFYLRPVHHMLYFGSLHFQEFDGSAIIFWLLFCYFFFQKWWITCSPINLHGNLEHFSQNFFNNKPFCRTLQDLYAFILYMSYDLISIGHVSKLKAFSRPTDETLYNNWKSHKKKYRIIVETTSGSGMKFRKS